MRVHIFWVIVSSFLLGVFVRSIVVFSWTTIGFFIVLGSLCALLPFVSEVEKRAAALAALFCMFFALGAWRMESAIVGSDPSIDAYIGTKVVIEGVVVQEPDVRENTVRIPVRIVTIASTTVESTLSVIVSAPLHTDVRYGDRVRVQGKLRTPDRFETGRAKTAEGGSPDRSHSDRFRGRFFEYPGYLAKDRILYTMSFASVDVLEREGGNALKKIAITIKQKYLEGLMLALPEPQAGLGGGITVGDKRGLGEELAETFRVVGLTHIVVLSGYNIIVVVDALLRALAHSPQVLRLSVGAFVAFFFAAITGFASASTRAALMAMIAIFGKATGRMYLAGRALALVALCMVFFNPYLLVFDPGFQLSVIATAGLIVFAPLIEPYLSWLSVRFGLREIAAATLGTQIAVLPLLLYQNSMLSIFALPVNLLVLIAVPWAMLFSALAALFGLFTGVLAPFFGFPAYVLLSYIIGIAKVFAVLPLATLSVPAFNAVWIFIVYALLFGGTYLLKK